MSSASDLASLVDRYEIEVPCHTCGKSHWLTIRFIRENLEARCGGCGSLMLLRLSQITAEIRNVERSLKAVHTRLRDRV